MTSDKQIAANRKSAETSTGPRSEDGKNAVRHNALKHGLRAQAVVLPDEDPEAFDELRERLRAEQRPVGEQECQLVDRIAEYMWRLRRAARIEAGILTHYSQEVTRQHLLRLVEDDQSDPLMPEVVNALTDIHNERAKTIRLVEEELRARKQAARDSGPKDEDRDSPAQKGTAETAEKKGPLLTGLKQGLNLDALEDAKTRFEGLIAIQHSDATRNLEVAASGASVGEAFLSDAMGSDALGKLTRYETALMNNLRKAQRMLKELQDGRVEQAPD